MRGHISPPSILHYPAALTVIERWGVTRLTTPGSDAPWELSASPSQDREAKAGPSPLHSSSTRNPALFTLLPELGLNTGHMVPKVAFLRQDQGAGPSQVLFHRDLSTWELLESLRGQVLCVEIFVVNVFKFLGPEGWIQI